MFYLNLAIIDNYYNCNQRTDEEWANEASPNLFLGIFYIAISIFFQILYIPGILALGSKNFIKISAYKIMFVLGLIDIFMLFIIGFAAGFLTIKGSVFCMNRYFTYYTGVIAMGGWVSSCAVTTVLAFSRVLDLYDPYICNMFFDGNKTWLVLCLPLAYFLYFISFTNPLLFSSKLYAFALDPFLGISGVDTYNHDYLNYPLITHDFAIVVIISLLYIIFFYILYRKGTTAGEHSLSPTEKSILRQTLLILGAAFIASLMYAYFNLFSVNNIFSIMGHVLWILSHSIGSCVYLFMNKSIQKYIWENLIPKQLKELSKLTSVVKPIKNTIRIPQIKVASIR